MKNIYVLFAVCGLFSCGNAPVSEEKEDSISVAARPEPENLSIYGIVSASREHQQLARAMDSAVLRDVLEGTGPFTLFAPDNAAFGALTAGRMDSLFQRENRGELTRLLSRHIVAGELKSSDFSNGDQLRTLSGSELKVTITDGMIMIDSAVITTADVRADNGTIHQINKMLLPPQKRD